MLNFSSLLYVITQGQDSLVWTWADGEQNGDEKKAWMEKGLVVWLIELVGRIDYLN